MDKNRYVLKSGNQGYDVRVLQELLQVKPINGMFGKETKEAVIKFQKIKGLEPDGIVGQLTWAALDFNPFELYADTDVQTSSTWIEPYHLPEGEYVKNITSKKYIYLHHTAGRHNPYKTIDDWATDQRGRVGTHYVIGGLPTTADLNNLNSTQTKYDGRILQAINDKYWAYHLGPNGSSYMTSHSLSIELCNAGALVKKGDKFYTWFSQEVHPSQVVELETPFRGSKYYHRYSNQQLESLEALLRLLSDKHDINLKDGMHKMSPSIRFEYQEAVWKGAVTGVLSHSNVSKQKSDMFPQTELNRLIDSL